MDDTTTDLRDAHDERLDAQVRPPGWQNPVPAARYNLVVIGGGTAGLVTAMGAAGLGARVALVERHRLGGDCLNTGCVPSKALLASARSAAAARRSVTFGVYGSSAPTVDFAAAMARLRRLRADLSPHDSAARLSAAGIDVFFGQARFNGPRSVDVAGSTLRFARAVVATGARAAIPGITGLAGVPYLTNDTLFELAELPPRLGIVGAGAIGCEMAQAFARLGSQVYLLEAAHGVLPREDPDAAMLVRASLERDGVTVLCCGRGLRVHQQGNASVLALESHGLAGEWAVDRLLVATGRSPNVADLGLETAGIAVDARGVVVDDRLRTTNPRVFACGDVCSSQQFTHAADFMARTVIANALFGGRGRASRLLVPRTTYTSPEVAHVGLTAADAAARRLPIDTYTQDLAAIDRAVLDGDGAGFVRVHVRRGTDRIVGATIVATNGGDLIGELVLAMRSGLGLAAIASTIHPYPTRAEAIRKLGDAYNRTRLTPLARAVLRQWLAWTR